MTDLNELIAPHLPYLRRYARAFTGSQSSGDSYAAAALLAILEHREVFDASLSPKAALFQVVHSIWRSTSDGREADLSGDGAEGAVQQHLSRLTPNAREALLLTTIEEFSEAEAAQIMQIDAAEVGRLCDLAHSELADSVSGGVLIIEDESMIALDLRSIVAEMGHRVIGVASTRQEAARLGQANPPDLVLADVHLADASSGIDAVEDLILQSGQVPVIFITAFPELLLTGEKPEPAFLIAKPYSEAQVRSAVAQAMFFSKRIRHMH